MKHSTLGSFKYKNRKPETMLSGGHGQENINYLAKNKMKFNTAYQYKNGVRIGTVEKHAKKGCRENNKQCWFPKEWGEKDFHKAAKRILSLKKNANKGDDEIKVGFYNGVKVGVYSHGSKVDTVFPIYSQRR